MEVLCGYIISTERLYVMSFAFKQWCFGCKTMECLYGNGRKITVFLLTDPALVNEH